MTDEIVERLHLHTAAGRLTIDELRDALKKAEAAGLTIEPAKTTTKARKDK